MQTVIRRWLGDDVSRMLSIPSKNKINQEEEEKVHMSSYVYPSISHGDGELDLQEAETGLDREIILRRVNSNADGDDEGAG